MPASTNSSGMSTLLFSSKAFRWKKNTPEKQNKTPDPIKKKGLFIISSWHFYSHSLAAIAVLSPADHPVQ